MNQIYGNLSCLWFGEDEVDIYSAETKNNLFMYSINKPIYLGRLLSTIHLMSEHTTEQLSEFHIRPRFRIESDKSVKELTESVHEHLKDKDQPCHGDVIMGHATVRIPLEEQHYWSPQLSLSFNKEDDKTIIRGVYSPKPEVWTLFVMFYSVIGFAMLVIGVYGLSKYMLQLPAMILWWLPVLMLVFLSLYLISYFGQKIGKNQTIILHRFVEESVGEEIK